MCPKKPTSMIIMMDLGKHTKTRPKNANPCAVQPASQLHLHLMPLHRAKVKKPPEKYILTMKGNRYAVAMMQIAESLKESKHGMAMAQVVCTAHVTRCAKEDCYHGDDYGTCFSTHKFGEQQIETTKIVRSELLPT